MNEAEFTKRLLDMEKEVLALKTAHNRGLGLLKSYRDSVAVTPSVNNGYYKITVTTEPSEPSFSFTEIGRQDGAEAYTLPISASIGSDGHTFVRRFIFIGAAGVKLTFTGRSSAVISSIVAEYEPL